MIKVLIGVVAVSGAVLYFGWTRLDEANTTITELRLAVASTQGKLNSCAARLTKIQEAEARNATVPDNLIDFPIPDSWLLPARDPDATGPD